MIRNQSSLPNSQVKTSQSVETLQSSLSQDRAWDNFGNSLEMQNAIFCPPKPVNINFQVNDICNARCRMCGIWKNKKQSELSPQEFEEILRDPFFERVEHVGITGGEPTLRKDLEDFYFAADRMLPYLRGASFITNGFLPERALEIYGKVHKGFLEKKRDFFGMVSLDGVGTIHDLVRGRKGFFEKAVSTLKLLSEEGIPVEVCCTIVKSNCMHTFDLLEWAQAENVKIRFRVSEFIDRLYNQDCRGEIHNFSEAERKHLVSFFFHLLGHYETRDELKRTYHSIISRLGGGLRLLRCPYHSSVAVNLDSRGRFSVCAPKGKPREIGDDATQAMLQSLPEREYLRRDSCRRCIHDYHEHYLPDIQEAFRRREEFRVKAGNREVWISDPSMDTEIIDIPWNDVRRVLLVGWYGTETLGDVAILEGILRSYLKKNPRLEFILPSQYPEYSVLSLDETLRSLREEFDIQISIVRYEDKWVIQKNADCDLVAFAGGPLMDLDELHWMVLIFQNARSADRYCVVEGCGIGPVHRTESREAILALLRMAHQIRLRDRQSSDLAKKWGISKTMQIVSDPSTIALSSWGDAAMDVLEPPYIVCCLREPTDEYLERVDKGTFRDRMAAFLSRLTEAFPTHKIHLCAMHHFAVGGDDRIFARYLQNCLNNPLIRADMQPRTPREMMRLMRGAQSIVTMRFHSVIFASHSGRPFLALDYTNGGKVFAFMKESGRENLCFPLDCVPSFSPSILRQLLGTSHSG